MEKQLFCLTEGRKARASPPHPQSSPWRLRAQPISARPVGAGCETLGLCLSVKWG